MCRESWKTSVDECYRSPFLRGDISLLPVITVLYNYGVEPENFRATFESEYYVVYRIRPHRNVIRYLRQVGPSAVQLPRTIHGQSNRILGSLSASGSALCIFDYCYQLCETFVLPVSRPIEPGGVEPVARGCP